MINKKKAIKAGMTRKQEKAIMMPKHYTERDIKNTISWAFAYMAERRNVEPINVKEIEKCFSTIKTIL